MTILNEVNKVIDETVRPYIKSHGGDVKVSEITDDGVVYLNLSGACAGCPSADQSTKAMVEEVLLSRIPQLHAVEIDRKTDPEMLEFVTKILNHEIVLD